MSISSKKRLNRQRAIIFYSIMTIIFLHVSIILCFVTVPNSRKYVPSKIRLRYLGNTMIGPLFSSKSFYCFRSWEIHDNTNNTIISPQKINFTKYHNNYLKPSNLLNARFAYWVGRNSLDDSTTTKQTLEKYILGEHPKLGIETNKTYLILDQCWDTTKLRVTKDTIKLLD